MMKERGYQAESFIRFLMVTKLLYGGKIPLNFEGLAFEEVKWKKLSIAAINLGDFITLPKDSHVLKFLGTFADNGEDIKLCQEVLRVRIDKKIGRYTNDFIGEFGRIFHKGTEGSIEFAVSVLRELGSKGPEYKAIIAKWLSCYETRTGYKNILSNGGLDGLGL